MNLIPNAVQRRLGAMFPGFFGAASPKHDHFKDYGWPEDLRFEQLYRMYRRNGLAAAGIDKTILKTWEDSPKVWETEDPAETPLEAQIRQRFEDLRFWGRMAEADRRSMVGRYGGVIFRFADGRRFHEPVESVPGGLMGLVETIPFWQSQLEVAEWNSDVESEAYGQPSFYQFNEAALGDQSPSPRQFRVHPDRVLIWSDDGTVHGRSALEPGFNDLIDAEKIKGAGGEGFWKSARGAPMIEAPQGVKPQDVARAMGVEPDKLMEALNDQIESFQQGFDKGLIMGGMTAKPLQISLPVPEHFFAAPVQCFAASLSVPVKILLGSQTGERASTEDAQEWARTCMARRVTRNLPILREAVNRLERFGILPERDWSLNWGDLTEASPGEKLERAVKMASINAQSRDGLVFTEDEIREAADFEPLDPGLLEDARAEADRDQEDAMLGDRP